MSGQLETVKKIEPIYKSPDKWDTHLSMHVKRGMQGSWDKRKSKNAMTPYECEHRPRVAAVLYRGSVSLSPICSRAAYAYTPVWPSHIAWSGCVYSSVFAR